MKTLLYISTIFFVSIISVHSQNKIIHDAEYYIIEAQNSEKWASDDKKIDAKLKDFRKTNGNNAPNILFILLWRMLVMQLPIWPNTNLNLPNLIILILLLYQISFSFIFAVRYLITSAVSNGSSFCASVQIAANWSINSSTIFVFTSPSIR